ncbi:MAG TPA: peptidylprolyl isomerase [Phycisphaerales bacterium]|nr:peptidylprolyl isomerase [Phycisphaerales bacterium]
MAMRLGVFVCAVPAVAVGADGQLEPELVYYGINRPVPMAVRLGDGTGDSTPVIRLVDASNEETIAEATAAAGRVDLAALFPQLWTSEPPRVMYAQLIVNGETVGAPVVIQPMSPPARSKDGLTSIVMRLFEKNDAAGLSALMKMQPAERARLRGTVEIDPARGKPSCIRAWARRNVVLETEAGPVEIALRPDQAPNTCFHFVQLVEGGFYRGVVFHRVATDGPQGKPFIIQTGDPTGTGSGGAGFMIDFEVSKLPHEFGVVSMARLPDDPNSNGSQFMICLSREGCAGLDGQYVSFAQVVAGADVVRTIAASPVGPRNSDDPASVRDRPLRPVEIKAAKTVPAPPLGKGARPAKEEDVKPVER